MYHWCSTFTGEIIEDFPKLVRNIAQTLKAYWGQWSLCDKIKFTVCWSYSRCGF